MNKMIKLYAKNHVSWKTKTYKESETELDVFCAEHIKHEIQRAVCLIEQTKRKLKPYTASISYYDFDTIKQIVDDNIKSD